MKKYLRYVISLIVSTIVLGFVAAFVPPIWARCECVYNEVKSFLVFPGSLLASLVVVFLTYLRVKGGRSHKKTFLINLALFSMFFVVLGFLLDPISDFIDENDIPIFQPERTMMLVPNKL